MLCWCRKLSLCALGPNWISETEFGVKKKRTALLLCQAKWRHSGLMSWKTVCANPGELCEDFYSNGSRVGLLIGLGCVKGLHSFNLVSGNLLMSFSGFFNLASGGLLWNEECWHLPFVGGFSSVKSSKILFCVSLEVNQDTAPRLHYCFLAAPPSSD